MEEVVDKVEYVLFDSLPVPDASKLQDGHVSLGFESKEWTIQFQTTSKSFVICSSPQTGQ
jgi:hypothetical protein